MSQLGKGRCACGSGLRFRKCCGIKPPALVAVAKETKLSSFDVEESARDLLGDYPEPFSSETQVNVSLLETELSVEISFETESRKFVVALSHSSAQMRAFLAAHIDRLATCCGVFATPT